MTALPTLIRVTGEHIAKGHVGQCDTCPIALAIEELTRWPDELAFVSVYNDNASLVVGDTPWNADLPQAARDFIVNFDNALSVEPFEFELTWRREP